MHKSSFTPMNACVSTLTLICAVMVLHAALCADVPALTEQLDVFMKHAPAQPNQKRVPAPPEQTDVSQKRVPAPPEQTDVSQKRVPAPPEQNTPLCVVYAGSSTTLQPGGAARPINVAGGIMTVSKGGLIADRFGTIMVTVPGLYRITGQMLLAVQGAPVSGHIRVSIGDSRGMNDFALTYQDGFSAVGMWSVIVMGYVQCYSNQTLALWIRSTTSYTVSIYDGPLNTYLAAEYLQP